MENFATTAGIALIFILIALGLLGLGWLVTGRQKIEGGACGKDPTRKRDEECNTKISCMLCEEDEEKKQNDESEKES